MVLTRRVIQNVYMLTECFKGRKMIPELEDPALLQTVKLALGSFF
jgi:hypothetical protein